MRYPALHSHLRVFGLLLVAGAILRADVTDSSATGFISVNVLRIAVSADNVFKTAVGDIGSWWDPAHTWSGDASNLSIRPAAGGHFLEDLPGGGSVIHLIVVNVDPGRLLRFQGGLGPLQSMAVAGSLTWKFTETDGSTEVRWTYAVTGYSPGGMARLSVPVDAVLNQQVQRLKRFIETGNP